MIPNNNLSVLPWYSSIEEQNARRWWAYGRIYPLYVSTDALIPFQVIRPHNSGHTIDLFEIYTAAGEFVGDFTDAVELEIIIKQDAIPGYDVLVYAAEMSDVVHLAPGQYYARMSDGEGNTWYSEVFTAVDDLEPYLCIEWWDDDDFVMDGGVVVYDVPGYAEPFKNRVFLKADIAKPEYIFEEEGETRDGYFFPVKQISEKRYRFSFLASEYLLDVMRLIRMADHVKITYHGQQYSPDTFLLSPEWESNGDVAAVEAEFDTATVAKRIGRMV